MSSTSQLNGSLLGRLAETGLLEQGRQMLRRKVEAEPQNAALWMRLADLERERGALSEAARCYRMAAKDPKFGTEPLAIASMLDGDPTGLVHVDPRRVEPFLIRPIPLSGDDLSSLVTILDQSADQRLPGRVVGRGDVRYEPVTRKALSRKLPAELKDATLKAFDAMASDAARCLFSEVPTFADVSHDVIDYVAGGGYVPHPDRGAKGQLFERRVLTIVAYLDVDTSTYTGGDLLIHDASGHSVTRLQPVTGMAVAFRSEAVHEVTALRGPAPDTPCRRTTLALWYEEVEQDEAQA